MDLASPTTPVHDDQEDMQLPTPPLTGGFEKRERLALPEHHDFQPISAISFRSQQVTTSFSNVSTTVSVVSISDGDVGAFQASNSYESCMDNIPENKSSVSTATEPFNTATSRSFATLALVIDAFSIDQNFDFMRLPFTIRKRVYTLLLTVPALVCVRQRRTPTYNECNAYLFAEHKELLPGIAFVLTQATVRGVKARFSSSSYSNANILCVSKQIYNEAKPVLYGVNNFELANLTKETSPAVNFRVPLFPIGYQRHIKHLTVRANAIYGFQYIVKNGGHAEMKNAYRGVEDLTLILEIESIKRGYGKLLVRLDEEKWVTYVKRIHRLLQLELFDCASLCKSIPIWVNFKALFVGDIFIDKIGGVDTRDMNVSASEVDVRETQLKAAVSEAFELFKKGGKA
jgi:hypothetical protein